MEYSFFLRVFLTCVKNVFARVLINFAADMAFFRVAPVRLLGGAIVSIVSLIFFVRIGFFARALRGWG